MPLVFDVESGTQVDVLIAVAEYRRFIGDTTTTDADVEQAMLDAQKLVEEWLRRELSQKQRTETLRVYGDRVYPSSTPLLSTTSGTIDRTAIIPKTTANSNLDWLSGGWQDCLDDSATVTYVGGFTDSTLPRTLQLAIARTARELLDGAITSTDVPDGASSISVGDVRVTYRDTAVVSKSGGLSEGVKQSIRRYRREYV